MGGIDLLGRLEQDSARLRLQMQTLARQLGNGQRGQVLGDLTPQLPRALDLKTELARRDIYGGAIDQAIERSAATQSVLSRLIAIGREFAEDVAMKIDPRDPVAIGPFAERARAALVEVGQLLNTRYAGEYLFGGSDFANPPIPDPEGLPSGGMATQIATAVATLGGGNAATVAATTKIVAQTDDTPFSTFLTTTGLTEPRRSVPTEDGAMVGYGLFANRNASAPSTGETTGAWARDLMRGLMSLASLTPANAASEADLQDFAATIRDGLRSATNALADEAGALGQTEARLKATRDLHEMVQVTLTDQLADIEEVDLAETLTRLQQTQTALEASYGAIARLGSLSLVQFLR